MWKRRSKQRKMQVILLHLLVRYDFIDFSFMIQVSCIKTFMNKQQV